MLKTQMKIKRSFRIISKNNNELPLIEDFLKAEDYEFEEDTFFPLARRCTLEKNSLGNSLAHYFGLIYIQDRASMLPPVALKQNMEITDKNITILDMCASPGSKTSMLSNIFNTNTTIIANEPNSTRLANLRRNLELMQCFNVVTCNYSGEKIPLADQSFDHILLDPPCSGWGTIDKNPLVKEIWTKEKARNLVALQKQLIKEAYRLLKVNGTIVYSTCTTNIEENEEQVLFAINELGLKQEKLQPLPEFEMDIAKNNIDGVWRLETKHQDTQGFFVAKFKKEAHKIQERTIEKIIENKNFDSIKLKNPIEKQDKAYIFGKNIYYIPEKALELANENKYFKFQGMNIGKAANLNSQLSAKLRIYPPSKEKIIFESKEDIQKIYALINGQSLNYEGKENIVPFYWKELYLGNLTKKGNRLLWAK